MTANAARLEAERFRRQTELIVTMTLKHKGELNVMISAREARKRYGSWFNKAVEAGMLVGVKNGNRVDYSVEDILALQASELQRAKEQAEDYLV